MDISDNKIITITGWIPRQSKPFWDFFMEDMFTVNRKYRRTFHDLENPVIHVGAFGEMKDNPVFPWMRLNTSRVRGDGDPADGKYHSIPAINYQGFFWISHRRTKKGTTIRPFTSLIPITGEL
jgi:hypothetical protein